MINITEGIVVKTLDGRYVVQSVTGYKPLSRYKAEKAIGKPLAGKHPVHHANGDKSDDTNSNLVVCEDTAYHMLLHKRMRKSNCAALNEYRCKIQIRNAAKIKPSEVLVRLKRDRVNSKCRQLMKEEKAKRIKRRQIEKLKVLLNL